MSDGRDDEPRTSEEMLRDAAAMAEEPQPSEPPRWSTCPECGEDYIEGYGCVNCRESGRASDRSPEPGEAFVAEPEPRPIVDPYQKGYRSVRPFGLALQILFVMWAALAGATLALRWIGYRLVSDQVDNPLSVTIEQIDTFNDRAEMMGIVILVATIGTGILFMAWTSRLYRNLESLGRTPTYGTGWAVGGWLVPILNLWRPKQIVDETWRSSVPGRIDRAVPPLFHWWWALWIAGGIGGQIVDWVVGDTMETRGEAILILAVGTGLFASTILAFWVVTRLTDRQEACARALRASEDPEGFAGFEGFEARVRRPWWQFVALPLLGIAAVVIGYVGFALPEGGERVEGDVEGDVLRYDDHGISFTYPAELSAIELGLLTEEADEFSGSVTAGGESGNRAIFVQWLGAPTGIVYTNRDLITYVDEVLAAITADTDRLTAGDLVTTEANGVFVAHRSWSGVLEGDSANGVTAATMCRESNTVLLLQAIGAGGRSAAETMADLESVLESVDC